MPQPDATVPPRLSLAAAGVLAVAAAGLAGVLLLALGRAHAGLTADQVAVFYALPALGLVGIGLLLRARAETRVRAALLLAATGLGLLGAEALLLAGQHVRQTRGGAPAWDDTGSMFDELARLRADGVRTYPTVPGNVWVEQDLTLRGDTLALRPLTPTPGRAAAVLCSELGTPVTYEADRFGFNNPDGVWDAPRVDVALIGDSYTQGVCVDRPVQSATRLRARWSVLNLGVRGAGPFHELAVLREYATRAEPRVVVWTYFEGNDLWEMAGERGRPWLTAYLEPTHTQGLADLQGALDPLLETWLDSLVAARSFRAEPVPGPSLAARMLGAPRLTTVRDLLGFGVLTPTRAEVLEPLPEVLDRARADVAAWGGGFVLVYMPAYRRYTTRLGEGLPGRRELRSYAADRGLPLVDLDSAFRATGAPRALWAVAGGHLNADGYRVAAEAMGQALERLLGEGGTGR